MKILCTKPYLWVIVLGFFSLHSSVADQVGPDPQDPVIATLPDPIDWQVDITPKEGAATPESATAPRMTQILVTRDGNLRRDVSISSDGRRHETWFTSDKDDRTLRLSESLTRPGEITLSEVIKDAPHTGVDGISELGWLKPDMFEGEETIEGQKLWRYEFTSSDDEAEAKKWIVWIDASTRLPVKFDNGFALRNYTFSENEEQLSLPEPMSQRILQHEAIGKAEQQRTLLLP